MDRLRPRPIRAIHVTRKRLLDIENCKPFEVLNLGKYERQVLAGRHLRRGDGQAIAVSRRSTSTSPSSSSSTARSPVAGMAHLHGKKGRAFVHIGAVDAPVTITEIDAAVDECATLKQSELHVLGWEWEMGLYDLMADGRPHEG